MTESKDDILQEGLALKDERDRVADRLAVLESSRGDVKPSVFERVRKEYADQLAEIERRFKGVHEALTGERTRLQEERDRIVAAIGEAEEELEEAKLRHKLGEFDKETFHSREATLQARIRDLSVHKIRLEESLQRYDPLLERPEPREPHSTPKGGDWSLVGEGDYFAAQAPAEDATDPHLAGMPAPPAPPSPATLALYDEGRVVERWFLKEATGIGRAPTNDIVLKEPKVSRQHASVVRQNGNFLIKDLGSSNGTYVNGEKITEKVLQEGDEVEIGDFKLVFKVS